MPPLTTRDVLYAPDGGPRPLRSNYGATVRTVRVTTPEQVMKEQCTRQGRLNREAERAERKRVKELAKVRARQYRIRERAVIRSDAEARRANERRTAGRMDWLASE